MLIRRFRPKARHIWPTTPALARSGLCCGGAEEIRKMAAKPARKLIAIVVPPKAQSLDVSGPLDAFLEANRQSSGGALYEVRLVAAGRSRTIKAGGMSLVADSSIFDDVRLIDAMVLAGTPGFALA